MSRPVSTHRRSPAPIFAALGDPTRLTLIDRLNRGQRCSISQLTEGSHLTRQAVTKHLRVLQRAGIVHSVRHGRESLFELDPQPINHLKDYIDHVSRQWDHTLARLKALVETED